MTNHAPGGDRHPARMMTHYMAWANGVMLDAVAALPDAEVVKPRKALFGNIAHTFNHILVIEKIFQAHLEGRSHPDTARNTAVGTPFAEIRAELAATDRYYVDLAERLTAEELGQVIEFEYVDGGAGAMTRFEILLHLANHATYHRGFVSDMLFQIPHQAGANDLTVFLRDAWPAIEAGVAAPDAA